MADTTLADTHVAYVHVCRDLEYRALHGNGDDGNTAVSAGIPRLCR